MSEKDLPFLESSVYSCRYYMYAAPTMCWALLNTGVQGPIPLGCLDNEVSSVCPQVDMRSTFSMWQREATGHPGEASRGQIMKDCVCQTTHNLENYKNYGKCSSEEVWDQIVNQMSCREKTEGKDHLLLPGCSYQTGNGTID